MKLKFFVLVIFLRTVSAQADPNILTTLLQQGLFEEQANRNLPAAISNYQALAAHFDKDRQLAATAVFRLGECYRMQGKTNEAVAEYQRVLRDFLDETTLATLSRQNLTGLGATAPPSTATPPLSDAARLRQKGLLEEEIKLFEQQLNSQLQRVTNGVLAPDELLPTRQKLLELKRELAARDQGQPGSSAEAVTTDEEVREIQRIQQMTQNSPDLINAVPENGILPLRNAARNGQLKVAAFLLDHGADVNRMQKHSAPLHEAAEAGNRAMVQFLLSHGAEINADDFYGQTALHLAASRGFQAVVTALLDAHATVDALDKNKETPLYLAAQNDHSAIVELLLKAGANPNLKTEVGMRPMVQSSTALIAAAANGSVETVKLLLTAGADANAQNAQGRAALSFAAAKPSFESVKLLLEAKADANGGTYDAPLLCAIFKEDAASAELLLQVGAHPDQKGPFGLQTLHNEEFTPLRLAIFTKQAPMVDLLLKYKADPNDAQMGEASSLFSALSDTNMLKSLLEAGAKVDGLGNTTETPLATAARQNNAAAVEILLQHSANPNALNSQRLTPLHYAAYVVADRSIFELLLAAKADPNVRGYASKTPLDMLKEAIKRGDSAEKKAKAVELADFLRQHGALDNPPNWDSIGISRPAVNLSLDVLSKETNDWNQFTLLELFAVQFEFLAANPNGDTRNRDRPDLLAANNHVLPFPDLAHLQLRRPVAPSTNWAEQIIDLEIILKSGDCSKDVPLRWGDVMEIPERDHPVYEHWEGLSAMQLTNLTKCLSRQVQIIIKGQSTTITLAPEMDQLGYVITRAPFWIEPVIRASHLVLASSDLSRVKVTRRDPATGQKREWVLNCSPPFPNGAPALWLRDGDVIEVPEKP